MGLTCGKSIAENHRCYPAGESPALPSPAFTALTGEGDGQAEVWTATDGGWLLLCNFVDDVFGEGVEGGCV